MTQRIRNVATEQQYLEDEDAEPDVVDASAPGTNQ